MGRIQHDRSRSGVAERERKREGERGRGRMWREGESEWVVSNMTGLEAGLLREGRERGGERRTRNGVLGLNLDSENKDDDLV